MSTIGQERYDSTKEYIRGLSREKLETRFLQEWQRGNREQKRAAASNEKNLELQRRISQGLWELKRLQSRIDNGAGNLERAVKAERKLELIQDVVRSDLVHGASIDWSQVNV